MMRLLRYLLLFALLAYGLWPYYHIYRLDAALSQNNPAELQGLVDLKAIQQHYKQRLNTGLGGLLKPQPAASESQMGRLSQNIARLGDAALDQFITLPWVHETLRKATRDATQKNPPYLISGITFAFFESYDRFLIRLGELGQGATHVRLSLEGTTWKVTDIIP